MPTRMVPLSPKLEEALDEAPEALPAVCVEGPHAVRREVPATAAAPRTDSLRNPRRESLLASSPDVWFVFDTLLAIAVPP